jgi:hypothetical protein
MEKKLSKGQRSRMNRKNKPKQGLPKSIIGVPMIKLLTYTDDITSVNGATTVRFTGSSNTFSNIYGYASGSEYQALIANYQAVKLLNVSVEISRIVSESYINTVYTSGLPVIYMAYLPTLYSIAPTASTIPNSESGIQLNPHDFNVVRKTWNIPSNQSPAVFFGGAANTFLDVTKLVATAQLSQLPGEIAIAATASSNAANATILYSIRVMVLAHFAIPY